ncbi:ABC transporter permease [Nitratifractor salsuginis]|uniref:ABC-2 type transporter n=1 Tax=Nitratifractor salsuginis (strain DSM 16511 / JCM 12458 / E9I37-1) TaxID=749222 RepID=E6X3C7_NITSE|nr:ABC transporter permease [Nitratifractor salsuginis]ADV47340.1 ABC-2 type transporter [Nitratifractor salsuginis DSM 16511]
MNLGVIKAYMLKEFKDLIRSKMIYMVYILPVMILILFGYGIRLEVTHARTLIIDNDRSHLSRDLISRFEHSKYFNTRLVSITEQEALHRIKQAKAEILILIPSSFEKRLLHGDKTQIAVFVDGAFPVRATTMQNYVEGVIYHAAMSTMPKAALKLITIDNRNLFNQAMRDEDAIVPGLIGLILLVAPAILAALLVVKEKEEGTIFNFYASPVKKSELVIAKILPVFLLHSLNIFLLFLLATWLFAVPFRGSFLLYWGASELYVLISIGIGLLVSILTRTQIVAVVLTVIITIIPGFLYSGMLMPISSMRAESKIEAHIYPVMYYNHIVYDTFLVGQGIASPKVALYLGVLILYAFFLLFLGTFFMRKELR